MEKRHWMLGAGGLLLIAAIIAVLNGRSSEPSKEEKLPERPVTHERPRPAADQEGGKRDAGTAEPKVESPAEREKRVAARNAALEAINAAATTYDAAELPVINKYLYDKDPEIRRAAIDGMIVLGDAAAGKYLRDASLVASTEEERKALVEAADYAELPPVDLKTLAEQHRQRIANDPAAGENRRKKRAPVRRGAQETPGAPAPEPDSVPTPAPGQ
jgi:hypothetical protein